jgi:hypothetical protein
MKICKNLYCHTFALTALVAILSGQSAKASLIIDVTQSGSDVVATASGSIDLTDMTADFSTTGEGAAWGTFPAGGSLIAVGPATTASLEAYEAITGPAIFGSGAEVTASSGSGDLVAIAPGFAPGVIYVPAAYVSGAALSGTSTWDSTTIAALGLTPGTYTYTWGNGADADSLTLNIGAAPEPASAWLLATGLIGLAFNRLRKRA